jgi:hypothetical protein
MLGPGRRRGHEHEWRERRTGVLAVGDVRGTGKPGETRGTASEGTAGPAAPTDAVASAPYFTVSLAPPTLLCALPARSVA